MKKIILITIMMFTSFSNAQVGINTDMPDASSAFDINSTTGGVLIPRMTESQPDAIVSPAVGLLIYQIGEVSVFHFYDLNAWTKIDGGNTQLGGLTCRNPIRMESSIAPPPMLSQSTILLVLNGTVRM